MPEKKIDKIESKRNVDKPEKGVVPITVKGQNLGPNAKKASLGLNTKQKR